jgi:peptidoglycan/xylan/chitin deacetylase (PgdA/CDA1 family)
MRKHIILTYHAISDESTRIAVPATRLRRQLSWLREHGFRCVTVSELLQDSSPGSAVALTFDDGFRSTYDIALPLLAEFGFRATAFPIVAGLGSRIAWRTDEGPLPKYQMMTMGQVARLAAHGWEVGSHTLHHQCCVERELPGLIQDLSESRSRIEDALGALVTGFAYPQGCHNADALCAAEEAGYSWACTTIPGMVGSSAGRYALCRVNIGNSTSMARFRAAFSGSVQSARRAVQSLRQPHYPHVHGPEVETTVFE